MAEKSPIRRPRSGSGKTDALLSGAVVVILVLILTVGLWIAATGVIDPPAPRSYYERQIDLLENVVKEKPTVASAWSDWARALMAAKQYTAAQQVLDRADKTLKKKTPEISLERARLALLREDRKEALKLVEVAIKVTEDFRISEVKDLAERGFTVDPRVVRNEVLRDAWDMKAGLHAADSQWAEAEDAYTKAIYESPTNADFLVKRGAVYIELGEDKKARADFEKALEFIPDFEPAQTGLDRLEKGSSK